MIEAKNRPYFGKDPVELSILGLGSAGFLTTLSAMGVGKVAAIDSLRTGGTIDPQFIEAIHKYHLSEIAWGGLDAILLAVAAMAVKKGIDHVAGK